MYVLCVLIIGGVVGLLPGLFGVGGGFLLIPALSLLAGVELNVAVGSAACQMLGPSTAGLLHRQERNALCWHLPLVMLGGAIVGLWLGVVFMQWAKQPGATWDFGERQVPRLDTTLTAAYCLLLLGLAGVVALEWYFSRHREPGSRRGWLQHLPLPPRVPLTEIDQRTFSLPVVTTLGIVMGFLTSGLGVGGGIVMVPALVFLVGVPTHRAVTTVLALTWLTGIGATAAHATLGNVDLPLVCLLLVSSTVGGKLGSQIAERTSGHRLRGCLALLILSVAGLMAWQLYKLLYG